MRPIPALILVLIFGAAVWAVLAMAPSEDEIPPLIEQVGQSIPSTR